MLNELEPLDTSSHGKLGLPMMISGHLRQHAPHHLRGADRGSSLGLRYRRVLASSVNQTE